MKRFHGIDLSKHNIVTDWDMLKESNLVEFVILRAGGHWNTSFYKDPKFEVYYEACKRHGIPVGAYYDCGKRFYLKEFGEDCARHFIKLLEGKSFEMPVFMDIEVTPKAYRTQITEATRGFCKLMEANDYFVGIYASDISGFKERLDYSKIQEFTKWVARYGREPEYVKSYGLYQYSSTGKIQGIKGNVDLDIAMADYPYIIKRGHFNGN